MVSVFFADTVHAKARHTSNVNNVSFLGRLIGSLLYYYHYILVVTV